MRRIVFWRHGRTAWNDAGRFQGQTDVPLDEVGLAQAERAAALLAALAPTAIVSSDLSRALATADALSRMCGLPVVTDPDLRETYAGEWEGLTHDEIRALHGDALDRWAAGADQRPGGGEARTEVAERVERAAMRALADIPDGGLLVVVSHGGATRAAIGRLLGLPPASWSALGVLANCSWSLLGESGLPDPAPSWRLLEYNAGSLPEPVVGDDR